MDSFEDHCWKDVVSKEILEVYQAYRRETYVGGRPAVLAIDLYRRAFEGGPLPVHEVVKRFPSSCGVHASEAVKPIQELLALARSKKIPVIYTTNEIRKEVHPGRIRATKRKETAREGADMILEEFKPDPADLIIYKERASAFFGTPLVAHLVQHGINSLLVCGETTSGCVRASVVDAYSYGFHTVIVEECCFDRSLLSHKVNLFDLHHKYADVMHLEEVKRSLEERREA
ncbi:MAG: isochorismatase family protein [Thermodesulfobacteriota bacterium]